jgi:hypothetical protein
VNAGTEMIARDPKLDPQPGDILRCNCEGFARKILKREANRVLVQIGMNSRGWRKLATWQKWASRSGVAIVKGNRGFVRQMND